MPTKGIRGQTLADEILRLSDQLEGQFRSAFLAEVAKISSSKALKELLADIESGDFTAGDSIDARLNRIEFDTAKLNELARKAMGTSARLTGKSVSAIAPAFDVTNPEVVAIARNMGIELSTNLTKTAKENIRKVIQSAVEGNINRATASKKIRQYVGLIPAHADAVDRYYDTMLMDGVKASIARKRADKYAERLLKYRSDTIARTEIARAVGEGQTQMWKQLRNENIIPPEARRIWITATDERVCPVCGPMNGVEADIDGFWDTDKGPVEFPSLTHPNCRCTSGIAMSRSKNKKGGVSKVDELELEHWIAKHLSGKHDQKRHAGKRTAVSATAKLSGEQIRTITEYTLNNAWGDIVRSYAEDMPHQSKTPLYRGLSFSEDEFKDFVSQLKVGKKFDAGGSWTSELSVAEEFASAESPSMPDYGDYSAMVTVAKGAKGLHVEPYAVDDFKYQQEWVLPERPMKIVAVTVGDRRVYVEVEQL